LKAKVWGGVREFCMGWGALFVKLVFLFKKCPSNCLRDLYGFEFVFFNSFASLKRIKRRNFENFLQFSLNINFMSEIFGFKTTWNRRFLAGKLFSC
jgi:hypothetical protein